VFDLVPRSETTGFAALKLGRYAVLTEINPEFAKIACKRLALAARVRIGRAILSKP